MTDWWSTGTPAAEEARVEPETSWSPPPEPRAAPRIPETVSPEEPEKAPVPDRRRGILLGAAGAAVAGVIVFAVVPHGDSAPSGLPAPSATARQEGSLPAAGAGPAGASQTSQTPSRQAAPKVVTMTADPSGTGRVGAVVKVTIHNGTDNAITVMSSMMKGDDRSAVLGEGTLAPGARQVEPGETVTGTVEFAVKQAPSQVVLFDIGGNVVAASR